MGEEQGSRGARCCLPIVFACVFGCVDMQLWDVEAQARGVQISTISTLMPPEPTFAERAGETFFLVKAVILARRGGTDWMQVPHTFVCPSARSPLRALLNAADELIPISLRILSPTSFEKIGVGAYKYAG